MRRQVLEPQAGWHSAAVARRTTAGLARSHHWGSVRTLTPSSWTRSVECPTQVTVATNFARTSLAVPCYSREAQTRDDTRLAHTPPAK